MISGKPVYTTHGLKSFFRTEFCSLCDEKINSKYARAIKDLVNFYSKFSKLPSRFPTQVILGKL